MVVVRVDVVGIVLFCCWPVGFAAAVVVVGLVHAAATVGVVMALLVLLVLVFKLLALLAVVSLGCW